MTTLKATLQEACFMELEEMPSEEELNEDEALTFSPAFERKMKRLIRRADHPVRYRVAQAAACLLLAALLSGCTVLAVSPEARAAFVGWVRETYETWFVYRYTGEDKAIPENVVYRPTWIPEGYQETTVYEEGPNTTILYGNGECSLIFMCLMDIDAGALYIFPDDPDDTINSLTVKVGDLSADLYIDPEENAVNIIVWTNESGNFLCIQGALSSDELIKIAKSVEAVQ